MHPLFDEPKTAVAPAGPVILTPTLSIVKTSPGTSMAVTDETIEDLGQKDTVKLSALSQQMLSQVRASDSEGFGTALNQLVGVAKGMDPTKFKDKGILSKITNMFGSVKEKMLAQYSTVEHRMDELVGELDKFSATQKARIPQLEDMYNINYEGHIGLEKEAARGQQMIVVLQQEIETEKQNLTTNSFSAQTIADTNNRIQRAEKKIDDLNRGMMLAKQLAPEIRLMQDNARTLVSKFSNMKSITIPAWKNAFSLYLLQLEQKKGAELANAVDDATNAAFVMQADLLRQNTKDIAKAKEAPLVTYETLEHVQQQLLGSFDDMAQIAEQGRQARLQAAPKIKALEQQLIDRFTKGKLT